MKLERNKIPHYLYSLVYLTLADRTLGRQTKNQHWLKSNVYFLYFNSTQLIVTVSKIHSFSHLFLFLRGGPEYHRADTEAQTFRFNNKPAPGTQSHHIRIRLVSEVSLRKVLFLMRNEVHESFTSILGQS